MAIDRTNSDVIIHEKSKYKDIYQKRPTRFRVYETLLYILVMFLLAGYIPVEGNLYKVMAIVSAIVIIGGAPFFYRYLFAPEYTLTNRELMVRMKGVERVYPLSEVERASSWKAVFRLKDKKEPLMVSRSFLEKLDELLSKVHKQKKR
jgi:hypothetical protein